MSCRKTAVVLKLRSVLLSVSYVISNSSSRALVTLPGMCPRHAQIYNEETWTCLLSFDFTLSFNIRQNLYSLMVLLL